MNSGASLNYCSECERKSEVTPEVVMIDIVLTLTTFSFMASSKNMNAKNLGCDALTNVI